MKMSTSVASGNGLVVVTHVYREQDALRGDAPPRVVFPPVSSVLHNGALRGAPPQDGAVVALFHLLETFVRRQKTTLGTVQILIGVVVFLFGIVTTVDATAVMSTMSGIMFWGSLIHVIAGFLTVAAEKKHSQSWDRALLIMNIFSSVTAAVAVLLYCLDQSADVYWRTRSRVHGISGVMLVLSLLEFTVSAAVSVFTYKVIFPSTPEIMAYNISTQEAQYEPPPYVAATTVDTSETKFFPPAVVPPHPSSGDKSEDLPSTA
ncbi:membrane-spanning 4-domains subfamily A member 15-like [Clupea harengus]|uniref:Membrane-spanning 4-domains subfamily A member 15-like n=1 Tax=Clupea harengus TaxID=7950 RepID=A0A6P8GBL6_CLUHA|nr:membrane-spanning 4-domains subfamily A member 15-like [Clupea harengus]